MKKVKQICALIGIIVLISLYILTLIAAIFDNTNTMDYLSAALWATIVIPAILWGLQVWIRLNHKSDDTDDTNHDVQ